MSKGLWIVLLIASLSLGEAAWHWARYRMERGDEELRRRLGDLGSPDAGPQLLKRRRLAQGDRLDEALGGSSGIVRLARLLEQTDLEWTAATFLAYSALGALLAFIVVSLVTRSLSLGALAAAGGGALPLLRVLQARRQRRTRISDQLPDALEMMSRSLRAGHALASAFKLVANEMPAPIAVEFGRAFEQQNLGMPFDQAVVSMTERVPGNTDLTLFAVSVLIQRETGGNLVEMLEKIAETIRERYRFYGKLSALTAEGRLGGMILGGLPFVVAALLTAVNPDYMGELRQGLGRLIVLAGLTSWAVGALWMYRLAQVDY